MNIQSIERVKQLLNKQPKISIIPHKNPDGDAIGSCLALFLFLKKKEYNVKIVSPTDYPNFLKWLPSTSEVMLFSDNQQQALEQIQSSQLIFTLDFNNLLRADTLAEALQKSTASFVMIDHHQQPDNYAEVTFSDPMASSTCEMVYKFIDTLGGASFIDRDIATCLYTGIMTDTGSFKYGLTSAMTHRITAFLIEKGIDIARINSNVLDSYSLDRLQLLGKALENLTFVAQFKTAYITLTSDELSEFHFQKGDTEGIVNYGLKIKEAELAVIFIQEEDYVKISFRSKTDLDTNLFARTYFNGGGHINASGGRHNGTIQEAVDKMLEVLPVFLASDQSRNKS